MKRAGNLFAGIAFGALVVLASATVTFGQQKQPAPDGPVVNQRGRVEVITTQGPDGPTSNFTFVASEMNFEGKLVKGAPYSAQAVTESTQTLSDGNRIVNKSTAAIYRDSEGRTRREQTLRAIGPFANDGEPAQAIFINDPVAGVNYALDSRTHVASKTTPMRFEFKFDAPSPSGVGWRNPLSGPPQGQNGPPPPPERPGMVFDRMAPAPAGGEGGNVVMEWHGGREQNAKTESLGKQNVEGVEAEGSRRTATIPASEIGNERAIEIVSERWYSPELQVVVMTRHSDPRYGETVYRLTNINRSEPDKSLFEVPSDYTIKATPGFGGGVGFGVGGGVSNGTESRAISGGVLNGKAISLPNPEYPAIARQARASGEVMVQITVDEDGNVTSARAVSGHPLLQAAAVAAARQAKFSPTKLQGQPVKIQGQVIYNFTPE